MTLKLGYIVEPYLKATLKTQAFRGHVYDGDTKTATKIRSDVPELKEHVEIWNDLNHMSINVGKQLREETELSEAEATKLQSSFYRAVKQAREEEKVRRERRGQKDNRRANKIHAQAHRRCHPALLQ